jgi:glycosyltransferase involved in cell wall biosynthesis
MRKVYLEEFKTDSTVIAYGANIRYSNKQQLIKQWHLKKDEYYLIVGRLIPDNNALLILQAFVASKSNKKLVIVGDVPYEDEYATNIKKIKDDRVLFTGYVNGSEQLAELYHNCFAYFHGHEFGGTNPTLLKALAYGCGILAIDTVFSREVLNGDEYGFYFSKKAESIIDLIESVEANSIQLNNFKEKSRNRIVEKYTWEKIADQYFELVKSLATKKIKSVS